jgi:hypothetical protein
MTAPFRSRTSLLARDELLVLDGTHGATIVLDYGVVWMTLEHDSRDIVLGAGERFRIDRPGRTVLMAQMPTSLRVITPVRFAWVRRVGAAALRLARRLLVRPRQVGYY